MEAECHTEPAGINLPGCESPCQLPILRNAELSDARAVAEILAAAFPSLYHGTFGHRSQPEIIALLHALYAAGHLSLADTRVCDLSGQVTGVIILHTGLSIGRGSPADYWRLLRKRFGTWRAPRIFCGSLMANIMLDRRIPRAADLVYIEALAVSEAYRGQGVGSRLLADAEHWARAHGRSRLALHVLASNMGARRLYERAGFRPWHQPASRSRWQASLPAPSWSAILMSRKLDSRVN